MFDLSGFLDVDAPVVMKYSKGGHYDWHVDLGPGMSNRKLSCVVQLSDPSDYEGGELQMNSGSQVISVPREKGLVTFFSLNPPGSCPCPIPNSLSWFIYCE